MKPPWAASVWSDGDWIFAEFIGPTGKAHTIKVQQTIEGLNKILFIIKIRGSEAALCSPEAPTQHQVDKMVTEFLKKKPINRRAKMSFTQGQEQRAKEILTKMGLI